MRELPAAPRAASERAYLRRGLSAGFRSPPGNFAMRFTQALEEVVDPIVATLDMLPAQVDTDLASPAMLTTICAWLGVPASELSDVETRRALAREATRLARERGTRAGVQRLLDLTFPGCGLRVTDSGGARWARRTRPPAASADGYAPTVTVTSPVERSPETWARVRAVASSVKPAGVRLVLEVADG